MPECPVREGYQPRRLIQAIRCDDCGTELKIAGSTITAGLLTVIPVLVGVFLAKRWIGVEGAVVVGLVGGYLLPWLAFFFFWRLEPTGTSLDLGQFRDRRSGSRLS